MSIELQNYFSQRLSECRSSFDLSRLPPRPGSRIRPAPSDDDLISEHLKPKYAILAKTGKVVWGTVAQVNLGMFSAGSEDLPGVTVYSLDPHYDANPQDLFMIGMACMQFKSTDPVDPELKEVADRLTDEFDMTPRMPLPKRLTDGREVYLGATMFHRTRLPYRVLRANLVPLVVDLSSTAINMVLPMPYWSRILCDDWNTLQRTKLQAIPVNSTAMAVAEAAEVLVRPARIPHWNVDTAPVFVASSMVASFNDYIARNRNEPGFFFPILSVGLKDDGGKFVALVADYDRRTEMWFMSNGIPVVIQKNQVERLRGATIEFQDNEFQRGTIVRLSDE